MLKLNCRKVPEKFFRYRFAICFILFIFCIIFEITGSSIGCWATYLGRTDSDVLVGTSRPIRTDEWAVLSSMLWSQYNAAEPFQYFSEVVRGCSTDVFLEYGQPVYSILMIFRPFYLGYLFLPLAKGMAFFWCGRLIALFITSFEFGRLLTKDDRVLSLAYGISVALSPVVSWWFAINGLVEMLIYIQLSIMMMRIFMRTEKFILKVIAVFVVMICAGGYILTFYPAWQVSLGYVLIALIIWTFLENRKGYHFYKRDGFLCGGMVAVFSVLMVYFLYKSWDTIQIIMNTSYPGKRFVTGGTGFKTTYDYTSNIWYAWKGESPSANVCEMARFVDLFPLCWFLPSYGLIKFKKKDTLSIILYVVSLLLFVYIIFGVPEFIAKYSLLGYSSSGRAVAAFGFCNLILLFRGVTILKSGNKKIPLWVFGVCVLMACFAVWVAYSQNTSYYSNKMWAVALLVFAALNIGAILAHNATARKIWSALLVCVMLIAGGAVNPIRSGIDSVENTPEIEALSEYSEESDSLWIVEGLGFPYGNLPLLAGLPTINSTNVYPNLDRWKMLDETDTYTDIYNRYAHITVNLVDEGTDVALFEYGVAADQFTVNLTVSDLKKLNVTYILSARDLTVFDGIELEEELDSNIGLKIYKLA